MHKKNSLEILESMETTRDHLHDVMRKQIFENAEKLLSMETYIATRVAQNEVRIWCFYLENPT